MSSDPQADSVSREPGHNSEAVSKAHLRAADILESITDAFMAFDTDWRFTYINDQFERVMARKRQDLLGRSFWDEFPATVGTTFEREYRRAMNEQATVTFEEFYPPLNIWVEVRAYPSPSGLSVFYQDVTARKSAEAERERQMAEQRTRAEREALLGRIGRAVLQGPDPAALQSTALALLGEWLAVDRCFYVLYDERNNTARIEKNWCHAGVPSLEGEWDLTERSMSIMDIYPEGETVVVEDVAAMPLPPSLVKLFLETGQRAYVAVPFFEAGRPVAALTVMMASAARPWLAEEVALVEAAAVQVRGAVEALRVAQREREAQARQRMFLRDVLASVTEGHLRLCDTPEDLPARLRPFGESVPLSRESGLRELRQLALAAAEDMAEELRHDLVTAVSEAGMNAVVHAGGGTGWVSVSDAGTVQVRVEDHGTGIEMANLPKATLSRGFSTKATLGHGLKMIIETTARLYLLTGLEGTVVVLEQERNRALPAWL